VPTYTYECSCGRVLDVRHSIHEEPEFECDNCGGAMERVIAATPQTKPKALATRQKIISKLT